MPRERILFLPTDTSLVSLEAESADQRLQLLIDLTEKLLQPIKDNNQDPDCYEETLFDQIDQLFNQLDTQVPLELSRNYLSLGLSSLNLERVINYWVDCFSNSELDFLITGEKIAILLDQLSKTQNKLLLLMHDMYPMLENYFHWARMISIDDDPTSDLLSMSSANALFLANHIFIANLAQAA